MSDFIDRPAPGYYGVFLDLSGRQCLIAGGGVVARRKAEGLLATGARVTVVAPEIGEMPAGVVLHRRAFVSDDLEGMSLVFAATDDEEVNAEVAREAGARGIWVNVADAPALCSMILPAVARRGALRIAVSTGGASPALARNIREEIKERYGAEYGELVELLRRARLEWEPRAKAAGLRQVERKKAWERVLELPLVELLRSGRGEEAERAIWGELGVCLNSDSSD